MIVDQTLLDTLSAQAKGNHRLRQSYDLRNSENDNSQRMLNALEPGTVMPIHRHMKSSESIAIIRGRMILRLYDNGGIITHEFIMAPSNSVAEPVAEPAADSVAEPVEDSVAEPVAEPVEAIEAAEVPMVQIEAGQWHSLEVLEEGTVVFEAKDGKSFDMLRNNEPLKEEEVMKLNV